MSDFGSSHQSDDALREHCLTDEELKLYESYAPGSVRVIAAGRYKARLYVNEMVWTFALRTYGKRVGLYLTDPPGMKNVIANELWDLAWHRASEAMLAVRKGHAEHNYNRRGRNDGSAGQEH